MSAQVDLEIYRAAFEYYGLSSSYNRLFQKNGTGLKAVTVDTIDPTQPAWIQMNLPKTGFALKKASNQDIAIYQNLTLDFELVSDPLKAISLGGEFSEKLIEAGLAEPGQPVEDTGAGCHIVIPLIPIETDKVGGPELLNAAVAQIVELYYKPIFQRLLEKNKLTGLGIKLEAFDISRIMSIPGMWRPGGLKPNEHESLLAGRLRCWNYPYVNGEYPQRKESETVTNLIKAACIHLQDEKAKVNSPKAKTTNAADWISNYSSKISSGDRSCSFHALITAAYLKFGEDEVRRNAGLIDDLTGGKYGKRAEAEAERSLVKASRLPRTDWNDWIKGKAYQYEPESVVTQQLSASEQPVTAHHLTDLGNARRLVERFGQDLRYVEEWGWMVWDGRRWKLDKSGAAKRYAKATVASIYKEASQIEDETKRRETASWAIKSESTGRLAAMLTEAESEKEVVARPEDFDLKPWMLNCLNGTLDLRTFKLSPHRREDMLTKVVPVAYDVNATCPTWINFLNRIMDGRQALIDFLQQAIGYSLTGMTTEQCLFLLWGTGRNGKSTFLETVASLMGDYGQASTFNTFLEKNSDGPNNDVAKLAGARFVSAVEADPGKRLAESVIKQLTGGDTVTARFLHKEFFEFKPAFKLFLAANHKPVIRGQDLGIWRRIKLIPFEVTIPESEIDRQLPEKLRAELPGILAWAVEGCASWQIEGLQEPEEVKEATEAYKEESDILRDFILECCVKGRNKQVELREIFKSYTEWCEELGEHPIGKRTFIEALTQRGIVLRPGTDNRRTFYGLGLK